MSTKKKIVSILLILVLVLQIYLPLLGLKVSAVELNQTDFVDNFSMSPFDLYYGEEVEVSVEFSNKTGDNMKEGDTLTLQVPENLRANVGTFPLKNNQGRTFGTVKVSEGQVICTFNNVVEELKNIKGNFYFKATAGHVETGTTVDYKTNLGTNLPKKGYSITSSEGGEEADIFFYKTGDIQPDNPDVVRWFLTSNYTKEYLGADIIIKDQIQSGQELEEDSFFITIEDDRGGFEVISKEEFEYKQYGRIHIEDSQNFVITIYQHAGIFKKFTIMYATKITDEGKLKDKLKNNYHIEYTIFYEDPVEESGSAEVDNRSSGGGGVEGDLPSKGTLRVIKILNNNEESRLEGVRFNIFKADGTPIKNEESIVTDENGEVEITDLLSGEYYLKEIEAPDYVDFDPEKKINFTIKSDENEGIELIVNNKEKIRGSGEIIKIGEHGETLEAVKFGLFDQSDNTPVGDNSGKKELTTGKDGKIKFENLPVGKYYIKEIETVDGYALNNTKIKFQVKSDGTKSKVEWTNIPDFVKIDDHGKVTVTNYKKPTSYDGIENLVEGKKDHKVDRDTLYEYTIKVKLPKDIKNYEEFNITDKLDKRLSYGGNWSVDNISKDVLGFSNSEGTLVWNVKDFNELEGIKEFTITFNAKVNKNIELKDVEGGIPNKATLDFNNGSGENGNLTTPEVKVTPKYGGFKIIKVEKGNTDNKLQGAEFKLTTDEQGENIVNAEGTSIRVNGELFLGSLKDLKTDENGEIKITGLTPETYYLHETKAPKYTDDKDVEKPYRLLKNPVKVTVEDSIELGNVMVKNSKSGWNLPTTGGIGTILFTLIGITFMGIAIYLFNKNKKILDK